MAWKPCVESIFHANRKPSDVKVNEIANNTATSSSRVTRDTEYPVSGRKARNTTACSHASVQEPSTLPSTIALRGAGDTIIDSRNPSRRSSISDIIENTAENITVNVRAPG